MTEDEARAVELVRAIEREDRDALLLTQEDRLQADAHARAAMGQGAPRKQERRFVAKRAEFAAARLETRHPGISALLARSRWPRWLGWVLPLIGLAAGFIANEFGTGNRLDLLAVPLLGTIAWNLAIFLWVIASAVTGKGKVSAGPLARLAGLGRRDFDRGTALHRAAGSFQTSWANLSAGLTGARLARTMHLAAALFAAGLIGGIYLRALVIEYYAGWESTFLGPGAVHALLSIILGPASAITGVAIPPLELIAAMRWQGAETGGVNAAPWIYLYTATLGGLVIVPRLLLAGWQGAKALRLSSNFPIAGKEDFYLRRLQRTASGRAGTARVTPYAYRPDALVRDHLAAALRGALGDAAQVRFDEAVDYGGEDDWIARLTIDPDDDYHLLLFTLSSTPEAENHGALATALAGRIADRHPGIIVAGVIDESAYRAHFAGQAGLDQRIAERVAGWRRVLGESGIVALALDLSADADEAMAARLESGLIPDGAMRQ